MLVAEGLMLLGFRFGDRLWSDGVAVRNDIGSPELPRGVRLWVDEVVSSGVQGS